MQEAVKTAVAFLPTINATFDSEMTSLTFAITETWNHLANICLSEALLLLLLQLPQNRRLHTAC